MIKNDYSYLYEITLNEQMKIYASLHMWRLD